MTRVTYSSYVIIFILALRVYLFLRKKTGVVSGSVEKRRINRQISLTIAFQTLVPFISRNILL
jgi:hypothetical protein